MSEDLVYNTITSGQTLPGAPLDTTLMSGIRNNLDFLKCKVDQFGSGIGIGSGITSAGAVTSSIFIEVTSDTVISVTGVARSSDNEIFLDLSAGDTVDITVSTDRDFTEASGTWYAVYIIGDSTGTSVTRAFLSDSFSSPVLPSGYDKFSRLGAVRNDSSSDLLRTSQLGNQSFYVEDSILGFSGDITGASFDSFGPLDISDIIPPTAKRCYSNIEFQATAKEAQIFYKPGSVTSGAGGVLIFSGGTATAATDTLDSSNAWLQTDSNQILSFRNALFAAGGTQNVEINIMAWEDII